MPNTKQSKEPLEPGVAAIVEHLKQIEAHLGNIERGLESVKSQMLEMRRDISVQRSAAVDLARHITPGSQYF